MDEAQCENAWRRYHRNSAAISLRSYLYYHYYSYYYYYHCYYCYYYCLLRGIEAMIHPPRIEINPFFCLRASTSEGQIYYLDISYLLGEGVLWIRLI